MARESIAPRRSLRAENISLGIRWEQISEQISEFGNEFRNSENFRTFVLITVQTAGGDARRSTISNLWYARVHRKRTVWKGRLLDPVGQALQASYSRRGSLILEGPR